MKHIKLLVYCCEQAEKDLRTGYGVGYSAEPVNVQVQAYPNAEEAGQYRVFAKSNNRITTLLQPGDDFLEGLLATPERVENYVSIIRNNAWKWAHSEDARCSALAANQDPAA